ncbi:TetR/AcrR family transcriptional regulator [Nocardioides jejuensis]|uniref:TetR/AcrR family transcriptional regulator n=1 Tax=Nocardioides jejuensis TaxID=2502782 RepID=A0A4R1CHP0_9ACTN|nr:TetR/AcrR family transcriptional regulator [Nocardioides jejuensis]TCJ29448.1 TetR/AcrR family transcriptional regulator [Nocardioides jejuensis]
MSSTPESAADRNGERNAVRRRLLLDAGVALLGAEEAGAVNVRAACRPTGVTERYFYDIFGTRDAYVRAVYDDVCAQAAAALVEASSAGGDFRALATSSVEAFVGLMIDRPDMGRVLLLAPYRESALAEAGLGHMPEFFAVVAAAIPESVGAESRQLLSIGLVGALTSLFTQFLAGALQVSRDALVAHCVALIVDAAEASTRRMADPER